MMCFLSSRQVTYLASAPFLQCIHRRLRMAGSVAIAQKVRTSYTICRIESIS